LKRGDETASPTKILKEEKIHQGKEGVRKTSSPRPEGEEKESTIRGRRGQQKKQTLKKEQRDNDQNPEHVILAKNGGGMERVRCLWSLAEGEMPNLVETIRWCNERGGLNSGNVGNLVEKYCRTGTD